MLLQLKAIPRLLWTTVSEFSRDGCGNLAAALSYYTVFSLPPLLVLLLLIVGAFVDTSTVQSVMSGQLGALLGPQGADQIRALIMHAARPEMSGLSAVLGVLALILGATGAFTALQGALNTAWEVEPDSSRGGVRNFLTKRAVSFAIVLAVGFLLLVSLIITAVLSAFSDFVGQWLPGDMSGAVVLLVEAGVSYVAVSLIFAAIFQYLPDAVVRWRHALVGGAFTGILFTLGKWAIGFYIGRSDPGSAYGAAGSLAVVLLWIYYSATILLLGAEFTQVWARHRGMPITPEPGAARVIRKQQRVTPPAAR
jgi:membrane protein